MYFLLCLLGLLALTECATIQNSNVCSTESGKSFKADPRTCRCYYQCNQAFYAVHLCCENGQHYNPRTEGCDSPANANCIIVEDSSPTGFLYVEATSHKPPVKPNPEICYDGIGYYSDPENDTCYFHCDANSYAHRRCCAEGLIFNPEIRACDW